MKMIVFVQDEALYHEEVEVEVDDHLGTREAMVMAIVLAMNPMAQAVSVPPERVMEMLMDQFATTMMTLRSHLSGEEDKDA